MMQTLETMESVQRLAVGMNAHFERFTRDGSDTWMWKLRRGSPQWMTDAIHDAHGGELPDDYIYRWCQYACEALCYAESCPMLIDNAEMMLESWVEIYTHELLAWTASNGRIELVQEAIDNGTADICQAMMQAQYEEMKGVLHSLVGYFERMLESE